MDFIVEILSNSNFILINLAEHTQTFLKYSLFFNGSNFRYTDTNYLSGITCTWLTCLSKYCCKIFKFVIFQ